jgi:hypothetical protein
MKGSAGLTDAERDALERLAGSLIPPDESDEGIRGAGFAGIIELRNTYQQLTADLYRAGLAGCEEACHTLFGKSLSEATEDEVGAVLAAIAEGTAPGASWTGECGPREFFSTLRADACFVYCTSEDVWKRIGFPGPSFNQGGYPDYRNPQA